MVLAVVPDHVTVNELVDCAVRTHDTVPPLLNRVTIGTAVVAKDAK